MAQLHVLLDFATAPDHVLEERAGAVLEKLYSPEGVAIYHTPAPPVTAAELGAAKDAFSASLPTAETGGAQDVADKNELREALIALLRDLAAYVETKHGNVLSDLLQSGFEAASTSRTTGPLEKPVVRSLKDGESGQILAAVKKVERAKAYEARAVPVAADGGLGAPVMVPAQTDSRRIVIGGLTPGMLYQISLRAVGGSTGHSPWSDPVLRRSL